MSKKYVLRIAAVFVLCLGLGFAAVLFVRGPSKPKSPETSTVICDGTCIRLLADKASPDIVTVEKGTYVQFNAADNKAHTLSLKRVNHGAEDGTADATSGLFQADEAWRYQMNTEGTFEVTDDDNTTIKVQIVVYTPGADYKIK